MRSESWKFIWQPKVSMRYFLANFRFRLSLCVRFRLSLRADRYFLLRSRDFSISLALARTAAETSAPANHPGELLFAARRR